MDFDLLKEFEHKYSIKRTTKYSAFMMDLSSSKILETLNLKDSAY